MRATAHCCGAYGAQNGAIGDADIEEVVEAIVDDNVGVVDGKEVVADEDLKHSFGEVEVHGCVGLRGCAVPIEDELVAFLLHGAGDSVRADALAIVVDKVSET